MDTVPKKCYDTVREQRDKAEVNVTMLTSIIDEQCYKYLPDDVKESIRIQMIELGV